jgi:lipoprotein-anchoring transpeptidase ErfK/SrfK
VSAGAGLVYDDSLTLSFTTGARTVATVDDARHEMSVTTGQKTVGPFPVSLGTVKTPTRRGTKVIFSKKSPKCLTGPTFRQCGIKYAQQLTYDGEYLLAAPWNTKSIELQLDTSNGCTNLLPQDAKTLYSVLRIGDVVRYTGTKGPEMTMADGVGDWDVPWSTWQRGGLLPTS